MSTRTEYRLVTEEPQPHGESRVYRTEHPIASEEAARVLASWWLARPENFGAQGWIEVRTVSDWTELHEADRERRGGV